MRKLAVALLLGACGGGATFPAAQPVPYAVEARWVVTNNLSDELSFVSIDGPQPVLLGTRPIGDSPLELEGPHHVATSSDGAFIYFNLSNSVPGTGGGPHGAHGTGTVPGSLVRLDAATLERRGEALVDRSPGDVILARDGRHAFVSHYDLLKLSLNGDARRSTLAVVDVTAPDSLSRVADVPVCPTAHGMDLSRDGKTLYVTCGADDIGIVDVADPTHPSVTKRVKLGPDASDDGTTYTPYALVVSPADDRVFVSCNASGEVRVYDPARGAMDETATVGLGGVAMFATFSADGSRLYVPTRNDAKLHAIDVLPGHAPVEVASLDLGVGSGELACEEAHAARLSSDGSRVIVVCEGDQLTKPGTAVSVATTPFALLGYVDLGLFSDGAAFLPPYSPSVAK